MMCQNKTRLCVFAFALGGIMNVPAAYRTESLDGPWKFARDTSSNAVLRADAVDFDDGRWETVRVPHDWAIQGPFDPHEPFGATGKLPWLGVGWYRRTFTVPEEARGGVVSLDFDGVMALPEVYVNGHFVGGWNYGYMSFRVDATPYVDFGGVNTVAVRCDTRDHRSRWYPGAGIYRDVRLVVDPPVHLAYQSTFVATPEVSRDHAMVRFETTVTNCSASDATVVLRAAVAGPHGLSFALPPRKVASGGSALYVHEFAVTNPALWDVDSPSLYTLTLRPDVGAGSSTESTVRFGIRSFAFTPGDGFHLNGRRVDLHGVNLHSDLGPLGMAFNRSAARRQLLLMKDMGANALRTSHNPPDPQVLDICDELGIVVWDECFDKWDCTAGRRADQNLEAYVARNLRAFVRRDRNHPCVVAWSIYNEINGVADPADPSDPRVTRARCRAFRDAIRGLDATRPVGCGNIIGMEAAQERSGALDDLDVTGWNYFGLYARMKTLRPDKPVVCTESASAFSSSGYYDNPPAPSQRAFATNVVETDSYDRTFGLDIPDQEFARMERDRYCAGEFVWTGIDYLGEPAPYGREARSAYFGCCDLMGFPKDRFYLYRSHWNTNAVTCHLLPHWNWSGREGTNVPVYVYTSGDSAELFLNGRSLGRRTKTDRPAPPNFTSGMDAALTAFWTNGDYYAVCDRYRLRWNEVPYEPGELRAVCYRDGKKIGEAVMRTAGKPVAVRLTPESETLPDDDDTLVFVQVDLVDERGTHDPLASDRVSFALSGPGEIVAVGNGSAHAMESFKAVASHPLFYGKAVAVVRRHGPGLVTLSASVPGLRTAVLTFK